jgi:hypothetical protein
MFALSAQAAGPTINGNVTCANNQHVEGVWVQSGGGGSKFASWKSTGTATASYSASISTKLPTSISLHVGCGGSTKTWKSDNFSPAIVGIKGSASISVTNCVDGQCSPALAYKAAEWAIAHLSGSGANHALATDKVTDPATRTSWSGLCLAFVASAYLNAGAMPNPTVTTTAADMYLKYEDYSPTLIQKTWVSSSATQTYPPEGAIVFYPTYEGVSGHIGISIGGGWVITANETGVTNPLIHKQTYNSFGSKSNYAGWAFPLNAGA